MRILILLVSLLTFQTINAQWVESSMASCEDLAFNRKVNKLLNYSVDVISVQQLKDSIDNYLVLDTREFEEYAISHIPGAAFFGYNSPKWESLESISKDQKIVVYCSVGYRSEKIGEKLIRKGFQNVSNLYGSIFEWANQGYPIEDPRGRRTNEVHTYNKKWSKWLSNEDYKSIY